MVHGVEIMQPLFVIAEELVGDPNLVAKIAFALETEMAFHGKSRQAGNFFLRLTEVVDWKNDILGVVEDEGVVGYIQMAVIIDQ